MLVWDTATGVQLLDLALTGVITQARWSPDGECIVAQNTEYHVRVWDAATSEAVTPASVHEGDVRLAFMTRKNRLATLSGPDLVRAWDFTKTGPVA